MFKWLKYLSVGAFVAGWTVKSLADGRVTIQELQELLAGVCDMLEIEHINLTTIVQ